MDQPYRGYALDLLLPQTYPADKAPYPAYDDVAWSLPVAMGVETTVVGDAAVRRVPVARVTEPVAVRGTIAGSGPVYLVKDRGQEALLAARVRLAPFKIEAAEKAFSDGGTDYPAGSWVITEQPGLRRALEDAAGELDLAVSSAPAAPSVARHALDLPRLAVLQAWVDTESAGWVRMILDDQKVPYTVIMDEDVRRGGLRERFDVVVYPNTYRGLKEIATGVDPKFGPLAFTKTPEFPTHGFPSSSPDITGGFTWKGLSNIEEFVRQGGVLVTLGGASTVPLDGGIARDVRRASVKERLQPRQ